MPSSFQSVFYFCAGVVINVTLVIISDDFSRKISYILE